MKLKLAWYKTNQNNIIEGICDKLPDDFCKFMISKLTDNTFVINLPGRGTENFDKRIRVSDANAARELCEFYLNDNLKQILRHQIYEMERRSLQSIKSATYYRSMLDEEPANPRFKKAS
jgi:hypothetical protein